MTVFTGTSGDDSILGTSAGDDFHLEQGGEDSADGGAGIDVFYLGAGFDAGDRIDGGADNDFLVLEGDYSAGLVFTAQSMVNVETIFPPAARVNAPALTGQHDRRDCRLWPREARRKDNVYPPAIKLPAHAALLS